MADRDEDSVAAGNDSDDILAADLEEDGIVVTNINKNDAT